MAAIDLAIYIGANRVRAANASGLDSLAEQGADIRGGSRPMLSIRYFGALIQSFPRRLEMRVCILAALIPLVGAANEVEHADETVVSVVDEITSEPNSISFRMPVAHSKHNVVVSAGIAEDGTLAFLCADFEGKTVSIPRDVLVQFPNPHLRSLTFWHSGTATDEKDRRMSFRFYFGSQNAKDKFRSGIDDGYEELFYFASIHIEREQITTAEVLEYGELVTELTINREIERKCPRDIALP